MWCPEALCKAVLKELLEALCFMYSAHAEHFADNQQYWISAGYTRPHLGEYYTSHELQTTVPPLSFRFHQKHD